MIQRSWRTASSTSWRVDSSLKTAPKGLDGEFNMRTRVLGVTSASMSSTRGWKSFCGYSGYGTGTACSSRLVMAKVG
ncbi:hypothetical protein D3C73_1536980 [compost metagenome]